MATTHSQLSPSVRAKAKNGRRATSLSISIQLNQRARREERRYLPAANSRSRCFVRQRTYEKVVVEYRFEMLHEFLRSHHRELIDRCKEKVAKRFEPAETPAAMDHGVPLFLQQLADTLRTEHSMPTRSIVHPEPTPSDCEIGRAAAMHGAEMLRLGFTVDQVVHEYGDVCQSVTDLAVEEKLQISTDEFRTLNRCLDNAIADAVTSFGLARQVRINDQAEDLHTRLGAFADEYARLVDIAMQALSAIKTGNVGLTGATGSLLVHTLMELRYLAERTLPEIRLASATTTI
jgi:hypothetical protein